MVPQLARRAPSGAAGGRRPPGADPADLRGDELIALALAREYERQHLDAFLAHRLQFVGIDLE